MREEKEAEQTVKNISVRRGGREAEMEGDGGGRVGGKGERQRERRSMCLMQREHGQKERAEGGDGISVTLKSKQGNEYHGSLQDGC